VGKAWFAVRTRSRAEKVVRDELSVKGLEPFLPTITRWSRWKDRKKAIDWPLFPGYCFARFDPANRLAVLNSNGVAGIVSFGHDPARIPDAEIDALRTLVATDLKYDPVPFIKEGQLVEVVHGPLTGVVGRLVRKGKSARLVLSVELIGQAVSAEVDAGDVRAF
jgi:transcription antitermination factor NusG